MRFRLGMATTVMAGLAVAIGLALGLSGGAQVQAQAVQFSATLSGDAEVPPVESDGTGSFAATLQVGQDGETIAFGLAATDIVGVTQAHIHIGPADDTGPVAAFLFGLVEEGVDGVDADGTLTAADLIGPLEGGTIADLVAEMRAGNAYVNVHTLVNAGGEIRGQIVGIPPEETFSATLSGGAEVPPTETDGSGSFDATLEGDTISFELVARDIIGVTQAHIHIGPADDNGPVTAFLFGLVAEGVDGVQVPGTITAADLIGPLEGGTIADLVAEMEAGNAYVNVHTVAIPAGEIRGQIVANVPAGDGEPENGDGAPEPEAFNILVLNAGGQFVFWPFGPAQAADVFGTVKIAWLFNATAVSWISFIPALGQTNFALIDGDVLWVVTETALEIEIPCGTPLNPCG